MATTTVPQTPTTQPRTQTVTLTAPSGERLHVQAKLNKKTGAITSAVVHSSAKNGDGKRTHARGATTTHATMDLAAQAVFALVTQATKLGWVKTQPMARAKADAFDANHIPAPGKPVPTTTAKK